MRIGTRASSLALAQARIVATLLRDRGLEVDLVRIRTEGDRARPDPSMMLARGAFVSELERQLRAGKIDIAVHSAKDMPADAAGAGGMPANGLRVAAYLPRADARDALVSGEGLTLDRLPVGARVGTESPRRRAFLLLARPDLEILPVRGNVDSRLARLDRGELDALVLAVAGLERLGLRERISQILDHDLMLPAVGQGALAVQVNGGSGMAEGLAAEIAALDDPPTRTALIAERSFLRAMGGGCRSPYAAHARCREDGVELEGAAVHPEGRGIVRDRAQGDAAEAEEIGRRLAEELRARGVVAP